MPAGAAALVTVAGGLAIFSLFVPDPAAPRLQREADRIIASRERHIELGELLSLLHNNQIRLRILDARNESDYNLFHLVDAIRVTPERVRSDWPKTLPPDAIKIVMSNEEQAANETARVLMSRGIRQVYILAGGVNGWLKVYGKDLARRPAPPACPEAARYEFLAALGARYPASNPDRWTTPEPVFKAKVKFDRPLLKVSGGCGG